MLAALSSTPRAAAQRGEPRPAAAPRSGRLERLLAQAERHVAAGRPARALPLLRRAAAAEPSDPRAAIRLAELLLPSDGSTPSARAAIDARAVLDAYLAASASAPPAEPAQRRARALRWWALAIDDHGAAIDALAASAGLQDEAAASALRRMAALAITRDDRAAARRALEAARRAMPQDADVAAELATLALAEGRASEAVRLFESVVARRPGDLDAVRDLAGARMAAGDPVAAARLLDGVARQLPDRSDVRLELARARLEAGDREGGIDAARSALELAPPDDPEPAIVLGQALTAAARRDEARAAFQEALRRRPGNPRATQGLAALGE